ncbi:MAG: hypothetical protein AAGA66_20130 [Bacteroidota bacterium]
MKPIHLIPKTIVKGEQLMKAWDEEIIDLMLAGSPLVEYSKYLLVLGQIIAADAIRDGSLFTSSYD